MGKKSRKSRPAGNAGGHTRSTAAAADPPSLNDEARSSSTGGNNNNRTAGCTHAHLESLVPGGTLDLFQPRDWPHRAGDPVGDPSLFTMPLADDSSPGMRSHPCENCGGGCLIVHDNVLCWKCKGAFCLHCTAAHLPGGPNGIMQMDYNDIIRKGWGKCPTCTEPLRALALIPVFRQVVEMSIFPGGTLPVGHRTRSMVLDEIEFAMSRIPDLSEGGKTEDAISECTHAINAINYHSALFPGGELSNCGREDLIMAHGLRAKLEGDTDLHHAITVVMPQVAFRTGTRNVANGGGEANDEGSEDKLSSEERAFRSFFYPLPAAWLAGASSHGLLCADMRTNSREVAVHSKEYEDEVGTVPGASLEFMQQQSAQMIPDPTDSNFIDSFGAKRKGCVFYHRAIGPGLLPSGRVEFMGNPIELGTIAQFIFTFDNQSQASEYIDSAVENGKAGDQGAPFHCKVDEGLSATLKEQLSLDGVSENSMARSNIKVLRGAMEMGPVRMVGMSVLAAFNTYCTRFWFNSCQMTLTDEDTTKAALAFAANGIHHLLRQTAGHGLASTRALVQSDAPDHSFAINMCSFCGAKEASNVLKKCTGCKSARFCGSKCQKRHWKMKGHHAHKVTCSRQFVEKDGAKVDASSFFIPGSKVFISGLKSALGQEMNGKESVVLSAPNADSRVELVLLEDLEIIEMSSAKTIPNSKKKLIKLDNLALP